MIVRDSLGREWDSNKHPRGRDGKFIRTFHSVHLFDEGGSDPWGSGTVTAITDEGHIQVRVDAVDKSRPDLQAYVGTDHEFPSTNLSSVNEKAKISLAKSGAPETPDAPDAQAKPTLRESNPEFADFLQRNSSNLSQITRRGSINVAEAKKALDGETDFETDKSKAVDIATAANYARVEGAITDDQFKDVLDALGADPDKTDDSPDGMTGFQDLLDQANEPVDADGFRDVAPVTYGMVRERATKDGRRVGYGVSKRMGRGGGGRAVEYKNPADYIISGQDKYKWWATRENKNGVENPKGNTVERAALTVEPEFATNFWVTKGDQTPGGQPVPETDAPSEPNAADQRRAAFPGMSDEDLDREIEILNSIRMANVNNGIQDKVVEQLWLDALAEKRKRQPDSTNATPEQAPKIDPREAPAREAIDQVASKSSDELTQIAANGGLAPVDAGDGFTLKSNVSYHQAKGLQYSVTVIDPDGKPVGTVNGGDAEAIDDAAISRTSVAVTRKLASAKSTYIPAEPENLDGYIPNPNDPDAIAADEPSAPDPGEPPLTEIDYIEGDISMVEEGSESAEIHTVTEWEALQKAADAAGRPDLSGRIEDLIQNYDWPESDAIEQEPAPDPVDPDAGEKDPAGPDEPLAEVTGSDADEPSDAEAGQIVRDVVADRRQLEAFLDAMEVIDDDQLAYQNHNAYETWQAAKLSGDTELEERARVVVDRAEAARLAEGRNIDGKQDSPDDVGRDDSGSADQPAGGRGPADGDSAGQAPAGGGSSDGVADLPGGFVPRHPDTPLSEYDTADLREEMDALQADLDGATQVLENLAWKDDILVPGNAMTAKEAADFAAARRTIEAFEGPAKARRDELANRLGINDSPVLPSLPEADTAWKSGVPELAEVGDMDPGKWEKQRNAFRNSASVLRNNKLLRTTVGNRSAQSWRSRMNQMIRQNELSDDTTLYRGHMASPDELASFVPGATINDPGIMSASQSEGFIDNQLFNKRADQPSKFPVKFEIRAHAGEKAAKIDDFELAFESGRDLHIAAVTRDATGGFEVTAYLSKLPGGGESVQIPDDAQVSDVEDIADAMVHGALLDAPIIRIEQLRDDMRATGRKDLADRVGAQLPDPGRAFRQPIDPEDMGEYLFMREQMSDPAEQVGPWFDPDAPGRQRRVDTAVGTATADFALGEDAIDKFISEHPDADIDARWEQDFKDPRVQGGGGANHSIIITNPDGRQWYVQVHGVPEFKDYGFVPLADPATKIAPSKQVKELNEGELQDAWDSGVAYEQRFQSGIIAGATRVEFGNGTVAVLRRLHAGDGKAKARGHKATLVAQAVGADVPDMIDVPGVGQLLSFVPGNNFEGRGRGGDIRVAQSTDSGKLAALTSFLIANHDAHEGNFVWDKDTDRVFPIDFDYAFAHRPSDPGTRHESHSAMDTGMDDSVSDGAKPPFTVAQLDEMSGRLQDLEADFLYDPETVGWHQNVMARLANIRARAEANEAGRQPADPGQAPLTYVQRIMAGMDDHPRRGDSGVMDFQVGGENTDYFVAEGAEDGVLEVWNDDGTTIGTVEADFSQGAPVWMGLHTSGDTTIGYDTWDKAAASLVDIQAFHANPELPYNEDDSFEIIGDTDGRIWAPVGNPNPVGSQLRSDDGEVRDVPMSSLRLIDAPGEGAQPEDATPDDAPEDLPSADDRGDGAQAEDITPEPEADLPSADDRGKGAQAVDPADIEDVVDGLLDADGESDMAPGEEADLPFGFTLRRDEDGAGYEVYDPEGNPVGSMNDIDQARIKSLIDGYLESHPDADKNQKGVKPAVDGEDVQIDDIDDSEVPDLNEEFSVGDPATHTSGRTGLIVNMSADGLVAKVKEDASGKLRFWKVSQLS